MLYQIEVKRQGTLIATHTTKASDSLSAINEIEKMYGDPIEVEESLVEFEGRKKRLVLIVRHWHGFCFHARQLEIRN